MALTWKSFVDPVVKFMFGEEASVDDIGKFVNDVTGVSSTQNWQEQMSNTAYQRAMNDIEAAGLNPSLIYGSGASAASTPSGAGKGGNLSLPSIDGLINSAANIMNANTRHYIADRNNKHLDWKEKDQLDRHTIEIYDAIGNLIQSSAHTAARSKM